MVFNVPVKIAMRLFVMLMSIAALAPAQILPVGAQLDAVVIGSDGSFYVAGRIGSADLPVTPGAFQPNPPAGCAASTGSLCAGFVAKVGPGGKSLAWATYFGAAGGFVATALAVSPNGDLYIARSSTQDPQLPLRGYQSAAANMFVAELSADSGALLAGTYFGGLGSTTSQGDAIAALRLDAAGNVYLAGTARSANFPTTPGAYQRQPVPGETSCGALEGLSSDGFAAKFDAGLGKLIVSTLVGSESHQVAADLAIGADGSLYVAGTKGSLTRGCNSPTLTRLTANGGAAIYSVTIPAVGYGGYSLAVDGAGSAYLGGDNRQFPPPWRGAIWKIDTGGNVAGTQAIGGSIASLAASGDGIVALGEASIGMLAVTADSTPPCVPLDPSFFLYMHYVARLGASPLTVAYAGYLPVANAWPGGSGQVVASYAYTSYASTSAAPFAILPAGPSAPGTVTCVANAANYDGGGLAPGEIVSLFGNRIGPATPAAGRFDGDANLASQLAGVQVFVGGLPAPLLYAGPNQINLIAPFGIPAGANAPLELRRDGSVVAAFEVRTAPQAPAFFTADSSGGGLAAALNQDGSVNSASNPAGAGSAVALFATGMGAMTPQPADGSHPAGTANAPAASYTAIVNGYPAAIEYIGNAPTLVEGVVQVNVRLPDPIPARGQAGVATVVVMTDQKNAVGYIAVR